MLKTDPCILNQNEQLIQCTDYNKTTRKMDKTVPLDQGLPLVDRLFSIYKTLGLTPSTPKKRLVSWSCLIALLFKITYSKSSSELTHKVHT